MAKRSGNINGEQKRIMMEFLETNPKLIDAKFDKDFTRIKAQQLWTSLGDLLNAVPGGGTKKWDMWRKAWHDLKCSAKSKKSRINQHRNATGGGMPTQEVLTEIDEIIVGIIGTTPIEGDMDVKESPATFEYDDNKDIEYLDEDIDDLSTLLNIPNPSTTPQSTTLVEDTYPGLLKSTENEAQTPVASGADEIYTTVKRSKKILLKDSAKKTRTRSIAVRRLDTGLTASERLADAADQKLELKASYYRQKLAILTAKQCTKEKSLAVQKKIADSLNNLVKLLSNNSNVQLS